MTYFHYYASTVRNLSDVGKYAIYPLAYISGMVAAKKMGLSGDNQKNVAANIARVSSALIFSGLSSTFFAMESEMIDANSREAVAAELGVDPNKIKFSDYKNSRNIIVSKAYKENIGLQKYRFGTDLMFLIPAIFPKLPTIRGKAGVNEWDMLPFAGKALYWAGETFKVKKSGNYEIVKLRENLESTEKDLSANDFLAVYQRTRSDRGLPMANSKEEIDTLRPLLKRMADEYNKRQGFSLAEIVYLVGLNKINIHARDGRTVSKEAAEASMKEIDRVVKLGLSGIRAENAKKYEGKSIEERYNIKKPISAIDKLAEKAFNTGQGFIEKFSGKKRIFDPEEYISVRDPGELVNWNFSVNR